MQGWTQGSEQLEHRTGSNGAGLRHALDAVVVLRPLPMTRAVQWPQIS